MRRVMTLKWKSGSHPGEKRTKLEHRPGLLHGWATESEDNSNGIMHSAVAIIEFEGGLVDTWPAHMVRFLDDPEE